MPLVSVPFTLVIFGFRSSTKAVLIGMTAGFTTVVSWYMASLTFIDPIVPGMIANLVFLLGSHYLFKQQGGWDKDSTLSKEGANWLQKQNFTIKLRNFNLINLIRKSSPTTSGPYIAVGFFCMAMIYATMHSMPREIHIKYPELLKFVTFSSLFAASALLGHPLWLPSWRERTLVAAMIWNFVIFSVLICAAFTFVIITNFSSMQVMIFMINLIIIAGLLRWQLALLIIPLGVFLTLQLLKAYFDTEDNIIAMSMSAQLKIAYLLLLVSSTVVIIFRPKQEYQALTEEKNEHLSGIGSQEKQVREALALRSEFIRNVQHEYHAPMTGITGFAETLSEAYDKLTDSQRKMAIDNILSSSRRLDAFDSNISSLSVLSKAGYELNSEHIDFSDLLHERVATCRKLYEENKEAREFDIDIEGSILINGDRKYLTQALDNLIINALTYCKSGKITIYLERFDSQVHLTIIDEGIGIPKGELENIFDEFTVSSRTRTIAGNRGVGLALCKRVVEVHKGSIVAESDGIKGATFKLLLPL